MNVLIMHKDRHAPYFDPLCRATDELAEYGVVVNTLHRHNPLTVGESTWQECDLLVVDKRLLDAQSLQTQRPLVVYDCVDKASTDTHAFLAHEKVLGVLKQYRLRPRQLHNEVGVFHRYILASAGIHAQPAVLRPPSITLNETALSKIHMIYGFGAWHLADPIVGCRVDDERHTSRDCDLHLACTVSYAAAEISEHRRMAIKAVRRWADECRRRVICEAGRNLPRKDFLQTMANSRAVLSPWGWGEACHRDYEAFHLGAVLIKPNTDHVDSHMDVYRAGETYVACKPDFSDLPEIMENINSNWARYAEMRRRAKRMATLAWFATYVARVFVESLHRCWANTGLRWPCRDPADVTIPDSVSPERVPSPLIERIT